jgi:hypothetical protein
VGQREGTSARLSTVEGSAGWPKGLADSAHSNSNMTNSSIRIKQIHKLGFDIMQHFILRVFSTRKWIHL